MDQDQDQNFSGHNEVAEVDDYFGESPFGLRGACPRQPVAPLTGSLTHIVATLPRSRALGLGDKSILSSAPCQDSSEVGVASP